MSISKRAFDLVLDDSDDEEVSSGAVGEQDDDVFHRELAQTLIESKKTSSGSGSSSREVSSTAIPAPAPGASGSSTGATGRAESRQQMERDRLERQKKREASGTVAPARVVVGPAVKRPKVATLSDVQDNSSSELSTPISSSSGSRVHGFSTLGGGGGSRSSTRFFTGAIKRVANINVPDNDSYSFGEIINGGEELEMAIVGAYCLNVEWVASFFKAETDLLLVMPRGEGDTQGPLAAIDKAIKPNTYRVIPETRASGNQAKYCCMHTKMIVLYFKTFVRIVIPTANAMDYDWAIIDNAFYVHDFPLRRDVASAAADPRENPTHTQFSREFLKVMHTLGVPKRFVALYKKWNFSSSKDIRLIATTQGTWHGWNEIKKGGGLPGLACQVRSMGFSDGGKWEIEATGSSIGQLTSNWLAQMMGACEGYHPSRYFRKGSTTPPHLPQRPASVPTQLPIKLVFPTLDEINGSWGGQGHGGTIFCKESTWTSNAFPKHLLHRGVSKRHRVTAHTKTIVAIHKSKSKSGADFKHEGFVYFGSHNFTQAAWGKLQIASRDGEPELVNNNYELGVLLPIRESSEQDVENKASELATFKRPLMKYSPTDIPWMQETQEMYKSKHSD